MTTLAFPVDPNDARLRACYEDGRRKVVSAEQFSFEYKADQIRVCAQLGYKHLAAFHLGMLHARYLPPMTDDTTEEDQ